MEIPDYDDLQELEDKINKQSKLISALINLLPEEQKQYRIGNYSFDERKMAEDKANELYRERAKILFDNMRGATGVLPSYDVEVYPKGFDYCSYE